MYNILSIKNFENLTVETFEVTGKELDSCLKYGNPSKRIRLILPDVYDRKEINKQKRIIRKFIEWMAYIHMDDIIRLNLNNTDGINEIRAWNYFYDVIGGEIYGKQLYKHFSNCEIKTFINNKIYNWKENYLKTRKVKGE